MFDSVKHMETVATTLGLENVENKCFILQPRSHVIYNNTEDKEQITAFAQNQIELFNKLYLAQPE